MSEVLFVALHDPASWVTGGALVSVYVLAVLRPTWALMALMLYLPIEPAIVAHLDVGAVLLCRYGAEAVIYLLLVRVLWPWRRPEPLMWALLSLLGVCLVSAAANELSWFSAALGTRQIVRFTLLAVVAGRLRPSAAWLRAAFALLVGLVAFEAALAMIQTLAGGSTVTAFMTSADQAVGGMRVREAVDVTWDLHRRVPGTLGRYDRLGLWLASSLTLLLAVAYEKDAARPRFRAVVLMMGVVALVLTYSRTSWFVFAAAVATLGWIKRDRRVALLFAAALLGVAVLVALSVADLDAVVDYPDQTLRQRVLEIFSFRRYQGEYDYLGRTYWIAHAPSVFLSSPVLGVGPGQFGGGAAAALGNHAVYDRLGLPFGVWGTEGHIDNNWLSLLGETGLLGVTAYLALLLIPLGAVRRLAAQGERHGRVLALSYSALLPGLLVSGGMSTALEIRTFAPAIWVLGGLVCALDSRREETS